MRRTPEQIEADEQLTSAIERCAYAYGMYDSGDVIGDYLVICAIQKIDAEGELAHSSNMLFRNGSISGTMAIGLTEAAAFDLKVRRCSGD
jgi:hypothetical protein